MNRIERDFLKRELGSLAALFGGMVAALLLLCWLGDLALKWVGLAGAVAAAALLRLYLTAAGGFKARWRELAGEQQARILTEYEGVHRQLPVYQGELHILEECLVWRSRRRLEIVLAADIARVRVVRLDMVSDLVFVTEAGKKLKLEFLAGQRAGVEQVLEWLRGQRSAGHKIELEGVG